MFFVVIGYDLRISAFYLSAYLLAGSDGFAVNVSSKVYTEMTLLRPAIAVSVNI